MRIQSIHVSNILSFKYCEDINDTEPIIFGNGLNIIIGENGAGKSTALEVINFLFKRVLFKQFNLNQDFYSRKNSIPYNDRKQILSPINTQTQSGLRLGPNWNTLDKPQRIRLNVILDEIDMKNIQHLRDVTAKLFNSVGLYTNKPMFTNSTSGNLYTIDVILDDNTQQFSIDVIKGKQDYGYEYLVNYNFYKELIALHNIENPDNQIEPLYETFTLISSYRNYNAFNTLITLKEQHPSQQIQLIRSQDFSKSLNAYEQAEPNIFGLVRLRVAEIHFGLISKKMSEKECEDEANNLPFIQSINKKLRIVNLRCRIKMVDLRTWQYEFRFFDLRRKKALIDINSLSAGQKAIIHLVFEAYGRGELKGGVVIIDEPEIHLHYQFQHEYLQVIRNLNKDQKCQYILVTHSEALINSSTINHVKRFSLNEEGYTKINSPILSTDQRTLIKILDNTRSTYAFFSKKVLLVEGDTDRYFFRAVLQELYLERDQEIAVLYMGGKGGYNAWSSLFRSFGLSVYCIADFDFSIELFYPMGKGTNLKTSNALSEFKTRHQDWEKNITDAYDQKIYILKHGDLERYLGIPDKNLTKVIDFCNTRLQTFLKDDSNLESQEIRNIMSYIAT